jgi:hypothetical protein
MSTEDPFAAPPSAPAATPTPPARPAYDATLTPAPGFDAYPPAPGQPGYGLEPTPPSGLAKAAILLTGLYALMTIVSALLVKGTVENTKEILANPDDASPFGDVGGSALNAVSGLVAIGAFVCLALWMTRIRRNLTAVGRPAGGPPSVEWWGWFVPFANFILPLLGMRALSRRSVGWGLLLGWWLPFCAVWLITPFSASAAFRAIDISTGELTHPEILDSMVPLAWASAAAIVVSWLFLVLVILRTNARHLKEQAA